MNRHVPPAAGMEAARGRKRDPASAARASWRAQPARPEWPRTETPAGWGSARAKGYRRPSPSPGRRAFARASGAETATQPGSRPSPLPSLCPPFFGARCALAGRTARGAVFTVQCDAARCCVLDDASDLSRRVRQLSGCPRHMAPRNRLCGVFCENLNFFGPK